MLFAFLNVNCEDDGQYPSVQDAGAALVAELSDYAEDTDLGKCLDDAIRQWKHPLGRVIVTRDEIRPSEIVALIDSITESDPNDYRLPILQTWLREDHGWQATQKEAA
jgi:hypothetical protein